MIDSSTIIATIVILLFSGFFSGMEIAFVSSSKLRFEMDREEQGFSARLIDTSRTKLSVSSCKRL